MNEIERLMYDEILKKASGALSSALGAPVHITRLNIIANTGDMGFEIGMDIYLDPSPKEAKK